MVIKNETKNTILSNDAIQAKTFLQNALGLIREKKGTVMVFQTRFGIHTFFMKYPIDVLVLDKQKKIVALKNNLNPNRIFLWKPQYEIVIELPAYSIKNTRTQLGDQCVFC